MAPFDARPPRGYTPLRMPPSPSDAAPHAEPELDVKKVVLSGALAVVGLTLTVALIGWLFHEPLFAVSRGFVAALGGPGVAFGYFLPDAFTIPLPNDAFTTFGIAGGMGFWTVVAWGTAGSLAGGSTGFFVGTRLRRLRVVRRFLSRRHEEVELLIRRYGGWALAAAALSPIPYSVACWAAGAGNMSFRAFFLVSQLRFIRIAGALYLIELGLMSVG